MRSRAVRNRRRKIRVVAAHLLRQAAFADPHIATKQALLDELLAVADELDPSMEGREFTLHLRGLWYTDARPQIVRDPDVARAGD